ncbi:hypothetical protein VTP01DRAFT_4842 [Rhizomucor pusillus]|uniref:uncharacterized protein n=1 Tax=Rhizomucor pusillus TaxID=4840 RepID=UPI0037428490
MLNEANWKLLMISKELQSINTMLSSEEYRSILQGNDLRVHFQGFKGWGGVGSAFLSSQEVKNVEWVWKALQVFTHHSTGAANLVYHCHQLFPTVICILFLNPYKFLRAGCAASSLWFLDISLACSP